MMILPIWFNNLLKNSSYKDVQFKYCSFASVPVKTSSPPAINEQSMQTLCVDEPYQT